MLCIVFQQINGFLCNLFIRYQLKGFLPHRFITVLNRLRLRRHAAHQVKTTLSHIHGASVGICYKFKLTLFHGAKILKRKYANKRFRVQQSHILNARKWCRSETVSCLCSEISFKETHNIRHICENVNWRGNNMGVPCSP